MMPSNTELEKLRKAINSGSASIEEKKRFISLSDQSRTETFPEQYLKADWEEKYSYYFLILDEEVITDLSVQKLPKPKYSVSSTSKTGIAIEKILAETQRGIAFSSESLIKSKEMQITWKSGYELIELIMATPSKRKDYAPAIAIGDKSNYSLEGFMVLWRKLFEITPTIAFSDSDWIYGPEDFFEEYIVPELQLAANSSDLYIRCSAELAQIRFEGILNDFPFPMPAPDLASS